MSDFAQSQLPHLKALIPAGSRLVVGCSGGSDSQALLDILARLKDELGIETIWAVGIDHGLRPEAPQELSLAAALAKTHHIDFHQVQITLDKGENLLAQAREKRYAAFENFAQEHHATAILVAHTATDQAETMLMHLARGTGLRGLGGMLPVNGNILRPLLHLERHALMDYLQAQNISYASDPSNASLERTRTNLRHQALPLFKELNPQFESHMAKLATRLQADELFLDNLASEHLTRAKSVLNSLQVELIRVLESPLRFRLYQLWLKEHEMHYTSDNLHELDSLIQAGRGALSIAGQDVSIERGHLWCGQMQFAERTLKIGSSLALAPFGIAIQSTLLPAQKHAHARTDACLEAVFDAERLPKDVSVGPWRQGEKLEPFGLGGHIKVGDLFTNLKIPKPLRALWPIVRANDQIIWIPGLKRASIAPITPKTLNLLKMQVIGEIPWQA
ncbi:MAG: tRNA lysidine(34) synthetase TilS [Myxococcota bacterium]|nr:tRNA lysidine(34) synthetase TilS [Myxococcota bacterium]